MRVFVAGGTGVVGRALVPQLIERGHEVAATTSRQEKLDTLAHMGAEPILMDGLDEVSVGQAVATAAPDVVVHQMTAISLEHGGKPNMKKPDQWFAPTNALRTRGTDYLLAASEAANVGHFVAQGYAAWNGIREGGWVKTEKDPLDPMSGTRAEVNMSAIRYAQNTVLNAGGTMMRYGALYGPGAIDDQVELVRKRQYPLVGKATGHSSWVHLHDAASATVLAVEQKAPGVYNVVDDEPAPANEWLPHLAKCAGAKPPMRVPVWVARILAGDQAVIMMTEGRGFSNEKAKRELGWKLRYPSWRQGFAEEVRKSS